MRAAGIGQTLDYGRRRSQPPFNVKVRQSGAKLMKWETPQASDMRFGFEITMYIATR
jgi:pyrroloquinoline quinone biosynthesis protein A